MAAAPGPGLSPLNLYVLANATFQHHITTASAQGNAFAVAAGYKLLGPQAYVLTAGATSANAAFTMCVL